MNVIILVHLATRATLTTASASARRTTEAVTAVGVLMASSRFHGVTVSYCQLVTHHHSGLLRVSTV